MPDLVLAPVGISYLAPHTGCPKRSGEDCVRSGRTLVPAGNGTLSAHSAGSLTLLDTNVLKQTLDEADDTMSDAMKVIHNYCRPAHRAVRSLSGSGFGDFAERKLAAATGCGCGWRCCVSAVGGIVLLGKDAGLRMGGMEGVGLV